MLEKPTAIVEDQREEEASAQQQNAERQAKIEALRAQNCWKMVLIRLNCLVLYPRPNQESRNARTSPSQIQIYRWKQ